MTNPCLRAVPRDSEWIKKHEEYIKKIQNKDCDVVFIGDSIIKYLETSCMWFDFKNACNCVNLGIGGDRIENVLWRIQNGELSFEKQVKAVVLLVGTNNVDCTVEDIYEGILELIKEVKKNAENSIIVLPSLLPKGQYPNPYREKNILVNNLLREKFSEDVEQNEETHNVFFVDVGDSIIEKDGTISDIHLWDYLHLTDVGYLKTFIHILKKLKKLGIAK
ncbi:unnamed protein product [Brassicogethes aeneus]|uniref:SGNH hydrolase-type esterase domain-containing protein n=1 Tax=Brassicogethes aeneus TaxID=1431903 RepID=A0A9P0FE75_BRAAE|nr:unnamed protein product [Brassicogethes aeneus]